MKFVTEQADLKIYDSRSGATIKFKGTTHSTDDPTEIAVLRRHRQVTAEPSKDELYEKAQELGVDGRSGMDKAELEAAVTEAEGPGGK